MIFILTSQVGPWESRSLGDVTEVPHLDFLLGSRRSTKSCDRDLTVALSLSLSLTVAPTRKALLDDTALCQPPRRWTLETVSVRVKEF